MRMYEQHEKCDLPTETKLYKIGMFAQMNHVTVKTLRFYEEQGLLIPAYVDEENGYRYYTLDQMAVIHQITALKQAGFTLEDIKHINVEDDEEKFLQKKKSQLLAKIAELTHQIALIDMYFSDQNNSLAAPILMKTLPAVNVACMRKTIDSYDALFTIMPQMGKEMELAGCECALPEYCFTQYLDDVYKEKEILIETCEAVTELKQDREDLEFKLIPEVKAACIYHKGSYDSLPKTYASVLKYIEENGYTICGHIRESYIDGIWNKDNVEEWLTEIQVPVEITDTK